MLCNPSGHCTCSKVSNFNSTLIQHLLPRGPSTVPRLVVTTGLASGTIMHSSAASLDTGCARASLHKLPTPTNSADLSESHTLYPASTSHPGSRVGSSNASHKHIPGPDGPVLLLCVCLACVLAALPAPSSPWLTMQLSCRPAWLQRRPTSGAAHGRRARSWTGTHTCTPGSQVRLLKPAVL